MTTGTKIFIGIVLAFWLTIVAQILFQIEHPFIGSLAIALSVMLFWGSAERLFGGRK